MLLKPSLNRVMVVKQKPNGLRYLRVGGRRKRHFAGTVFKPRKRLENAATPTRRVHAVLGGMMTISHHTSSATVLPSFGLPIPDLAVRAVLQLPRAITRLADDLLQFLLQLWNRDVPYKSDYVFDNSSHRWRL